MELAAAARLALVATAPMDRIRYFLRSPPQVVAKAQLAKLERLMGLAAVLVVAAHVAVLAELAIRHPHPQLKAALVGMGTAVQTTAAVAAAVLVQLAALVRVALAAMVVLGLHLALLAHRHTTLVAVAVACMPLLAM